MRPAHLLFVGMLLLALLPLLPAQAQPAPQCFTETELCINGRFADYWRAQGGLPVFGLPTSEQYTEVIEGQPREVQWFERARFELHPQNAPPYDVLLGRLGADILTQRGVDWQATPPAVPPPDNRCRIFEATGYAVCGPILEAWGSSGLEFDGQPGTSPAESLALFGLPLTDLRTETLSDGNRYQVQWFERARFELHPQNAPPFDVLLGLLGSEARQAAELPPATLTIGVQGEDWAFDQATLGPLRPGQPATLAMTNDSTLHPHNWVLITTDDHQIASSFNRDAGRAGSERAYIPPDRPELLAHTSLLAPAAAETISFAAPTVPGSYLYICTVPGHYQAGMHGLLIVE